jgi:hypothetical protein
VGFRRRSTIRAMMAAPTGRMSCPKVKAGLCSAPLPEWPSVI